MSINQVRSNQLPSYYDQTYTIHELNKDESSLDQIASQEAALQSEIDGLEELNLRPAIHHLLAKIIARYLEQSQEESDDKRLKIKELKNQIREGNIQLSSLTNKKATIQFVKSVSIVLVGGPVMAYGGTAEEMRSRTEIGNQILSGVLEGLGLTLSDAPMSYTGGEVKLNQSELDFQLQKMADSSGKQQVTETLRTALEERKALTRNS